MPSTKYSCSGSFDRFVKGSTTIESRGAAALAIAGAGEPCGPPAADTWIGAVDEVPRGHTHQTPVPRATAATMLAAIKKCFGLWLRPGLVSGSAATSGSEATAFASIA